MLVTNDDGPSSPVFGPFVDRLRDSLGWDAEVFIPSSNRSFVSKGVTTGPVEVLTGPQCGLEARPGWRLADASPAACVNLALYHLRPDCDLVVSGPNVGHNAGVASMLSSGTVGAAMEAALAGRRAIALSFPFKRGWGKWTDAEVAAAVAVAAEVTARLWDAFEGPAGEGAEADVFNVNVPLGAGVEPHRAGPAGESPFPWLDCDLMQGGEAVAVRGATPDTATG